MTPEQIKALKDIAAMFDSELSKYTIYLRRVIVLERPNEKI